MVIEVLKNKLRVLFIIIFGTLSFPIGTSDIDVLLRRPEMPEIVYKCPFDFALGDAAATRIRVLLSFYHGQQVSLN